MNYYSITQVRLLVKVGGLFFYKTNYIIYIISFNKNKKR